MERLIRKWAPIVWLAPEEKFMPLGVDEFLANVHFEHKDEPINTDSIPVEQISETAYLVTNTDIGGYIISFFHISLKFSLFSIKCYSLI